jgi:hypothetical protein
MSSQHTIEVGLGSLQKSIRASFCSHCVDPVRHGSIRTEHKTIPRQVPGNRPVSHFVVTLLKYL